jgi:hypothetical protein
MNQSVDLRCIASDLKNVAKKPSVALLPLLAAGLFYLAERKFNMGHIQALEILNLITLEQDLRWHLQNNYYPPVPNVMIPILVKAVILCRKDQFNETIEIPIEYRMGWLVPAYVIVEAYHLEPWVNELD